MQSRNGRMLKWVFSATLAVAVSIPTAACAIPPLPAAAAPSPPIINYFRSTKSSIYPGMPTVLQWDVSKATSVRIEPGGEVACTGTKSVSPTDNTTYTMIATNEVATVSMSTTIHACRTCGCSYAIPKYSNLRGYEQYVDEINCFGLVYPSSWIIDHKRFSDLNEQAVGGLTGISFSNGVIGDEYSYYDVLIETRDADFDKRALVDQYKKEKMVKGWALVNEDTRQMASDHAAVEQNFTRVIDGKKYDHSVVFIYHDGKFWIERWELPHDLIGGEPGAFSFFR